jgi:Ser/Thr protein kinase RdoA (MazF antagonist)
MDHNRLTDERADAAARELAGIDVAAVTRAGGGANSQIFRVDTTTGRYALKCYPVRPGDARDRGETEWRALRFLASRGIAAVPIAHRRSACGQFTLMEWIDGAPVRGHAPSDLLQAADFVAQAFALSDHPEASRFPLASEACLSPADIMRQIADRLAQLDPDAELAAFLDVMVRPSLADAARAIDASDAVLPPRLRRLIPADFGFHNTLRQADGRLRCLDFEYFGWDDPAKMTADFILHPAMELRADEQRMFIDRMAAAVPADPGFAARLHRDVHLYALRWVLILLNPFRRAAVDSPPREARAALRESRIAKARRVLERARLVALVA